MPIMFFFILYDVPAGLLIYWITNNILTIAQQVLINNLMKKRKIASAEIAGGGMPAAGAASAGPRLATGKSSAIDTKAKTVGREPTKEAFSERVTKWLEKQAAEAEKASGSASSRKKGEGRSSSSDRSSVTRKNKAKK